MSNYYKDTIKQIETHIENKETEAALEKLYVELSMPYIPEEYKATFEMLLRNLKATEKSSTTLFTDINDIKEALYSSELNVVKALQSLENMNLRAIKDDVIILLQSDLDDMIKRIILMQVLDQEIDLAIPMHLNGQDIKIDTKTLISPFESKHYQSIFQELVDTYESYDPSYLNLAIEILNAQMMESFPFIEESVNMEQIITKLNNYLKKG